LKTGGGETQKGLTTMGKWKALIGRTISEQGLKKGREKTQVIGIREKNIGVWGGSKLLKGCAAITSWGDPENWGGDRETFGCGNLKVTCRDQGTWKKGKKTMGGGDLRDWLQGAGWGKKKGDPPPITGARRKRSGVIERMRWKKKKHALGVLDFLGKEKRKKVGE